MKSHVWVISAILLLLLSSQTVDAQGKVYRFKRLDADITVQTNGDLDIIETQAFEYVVGTFSEGFRTIPTDKLDRIANVRVSEQDRPYTREQTPSSSTSSPFSFTTLTNDRNDFEIRWFYPATANTTRIFRLGYTVQGGLRYYDAGDQLAWKAVFPQHFVLLESSTVTVHLPPGFTPEQLVVDSYGAHASRQALDGQTVIFKSNNVPDGEVLDVRVQFPHGIVKGTKSAWQDVNDRNESIAFVVVPVGAAVLLFALLAGYLFWFRFRREQSVGEVAAFISLPPDDTPPGVVGTLIDGGADYRDILATLIDLARRGYLEFGTRKIHRSNHGAAGHELTILLTKLDHHALPAYEQTLIASIFGSGQIRELADLRANFNAAVPAIQSQMYDVVAKMAYYAESPEATRKQGTQFAVIFTAATAISAILFLIWNWAAFGYLPLSAWVPLLGVMLLGTVLMLTIRRLPARTRKGAEAAARWQAFGRYLKDINQFVKAGQANASEIFDKYLPYAVAFGSETDFTRQFNAIGAPAPNWVEPITHLDLSFPDASHPSAIRWAGPVSAVLRRLGSTKHRERTGVCPTSLRPVTTCRPRCSAQATAWPLRSTRRRPR